MRNRGIYADDLVELHHRPGRLRPARELRAEVMDLMRIRLQLLGAAAELQAVERHTRDRERCRQSDKAVCRMRSNILRLVDADVDQRARQVRARGTKAWAATGLLG